MNMPIDPIPIPLCDDGQGGLRMAGSRVLLESVLAIVEQGGKAEDIHEAFSSLALADIHAVLAWALMHRDIVAEYLHRRDAEANSIRQRAESLGFASPPGALKARLQNRTRKEADDAPLPGR